MKTTRKNGLLKKIVLSAAKGTLRLIWREITGPTRLPVLTAGVLALGTLGAGAQTTYQRPTTQPTAYRAPQTYQQPYNSREESTVQTQVLGAMRSYVRQVHLTHQEVQAVRDGDLQLTESRVAKILASMIDANCEIVNRTLDWNERNIGQNLWQRYLTGGNTMSVAELDQAIREINRLALAQYPNSQRIATLQAGYQKSLLLVRQAMTP